jgi:DNA mismatch endonuclease (patch repair protein)
VPATRTDFWLDKIGKNVERDKRDLNAYCAGLAGADRLGVCAERQTKAERYRSAERLEEWICGGGQTAQIDTQGIHLLTVSPPHKA